MSYNITRYNGTSIIALADGTINTVLDITLVGKNYAGYGLPQNENFVYLLENFSNVNPPTAPISGQVWFDSTSTNLKLNVNDGSGWKSVANLNVGTTPSGIFPQSSSGGSFVAAPLTVGDMWWDTYNNQLNISNGSGYTIIGPQSVNGFADTQMQSVNQQGIPIQKAMVNGNTIFTISNTQINSSTLVNLPTIYTGITLANTVKLHGTATNADNLNNLPSSYFAPISNPVFTSSIGTTDSGINVGSALTISNVKSVPTLANNVGSNISFVTRSNGAVATPLLLSGSDVLPGSNTSTLGTNANKWYSVYANTFNGVATKSLTLSVNGQYLSANVDGTVPNTVVARDANGAISSPAFYGAFHGIADLATYSVNGDHALLADVASLANTATVANYVAWSNIGNKPDNFVFNDQLTYNISIIGNSQGTHTGAVLGNVTGNLTGNVIGNTTGVHTGAVIGPAIGNVTGNVTGNTVGVHTGNVTGNVTGNLAGNVIGNVTGNTVGVHTGNVTGNVTGSVTGNVTGDVSGNLIGNVTGNTSGVHSGPVTGNVTGNATTATKLQIGRYINGSYFDGTGDISINTSSVDEGSNLYFTQQRARTSVGASGALTYNSTTGVFGYTQGNTDTVSEGATNLYFTVARARNSIGVSGGLTYNSSTGVLYTPLLAAVATSGNYNDLNNLPSIPAAVNVNNLNANLSRIVDSIIGSIDLTTASSVVQSVRGSNGQGISYGSGWSSSLSGTDGAPTVTFTVDVASILGLSNVSSSLYWRGNYSFNLSPSLTRVYDNRNAYYSFGTGVWSISSYPVSIDNTNSSYGVFTIVVQAVDQGHPYHGTGISAGWIGLSSRIRNVYAG